MTRRSALVALLVALVPATACGRGRSALAERPFVIAAPYELSTLDPHVANTVSNFSILSNVYEPLVVTDADLRILPSLASSWENPDPLTWVLHLQRGVAFQSGRRFGSADVVYSLNRLLGDPSLEIRAFIQTLAEARATDAHTVVLKTSRPSVVFLNKLHFALIVPEGSTTASLERAPDGTGPYRVTGWERGRSLSLRRNDGYRGTRPRLGDVRFLLGQPEGEAVRGLLAGTTQLVQVSARELRTRLEGSRAHEVLRRENIYVKYLGYDVARDVTPECPVRPNPFRDPRVREALDLALDRRALAAALPSEARAASQPVPRTIFGFNPALAVPAPDEARAAALLREAGLGAGFPVVLRVRPILAPAAEAVRVRLARVGIRVSIAVQPEPEFFASQQRGEQTLWISRYGCPTGDASDLLDAVIHSRDPEREFGIMNAGGISDPELDRRIERSDGIEAMDDRRRAVQEILADLAPRHLIVPLYFDQDVFGLDRRFTWQPRNDSYIRAAEIGLK